MKQAHLMCREAGSADSSVGVSHAGDLWSPKPSASGAIALPLHAMSVGMPTACPGSAHGHRLSRASAVSAWRPAQSQWLGAPHAWTPPTRRRHAVAAVAAAASAGSSPAAPVLHSPSAHVLWDLDNIAVAHAMHLPLIGHRLVQAVARHALSASGNGATQLTVYANERTLARLGGPDVARRALALVGGSLISVPVRK